MFLELRWVPELIKDGTKILSMRVKNLNFVDSVWTACPNHSTSMQERALTQFFKRAKYLGYVGPHPEPNYYWADFMSGDERAQFLDWYEEQKEKISEIRKISWCTVWMMLLY